MAVQEQSREPTRQNAQYGSELLTVPLRDDAA